MDLNHIPPAARTEYSGIRYAQSPALIASRCVATVLPSTCATPRAARSATATPSTASSVFDADGHTLVAIDRVEERLEESFIVYPQGLADGANYVALPTASYKRFNTAG